jgi:glycerophosphoryl diester phosphodiesterase
MRRFFKYVGYALGIVAGLGVAIYIGLILVSKPMPDHPFFADSGTKMLVIAHQGGEGLRPSNTMAAFTNAVELGADMLEMDIHSTKDGVLVTIHDATIDRTTNGTGRVQDYTVEELQQFDAGYHFPNLEEEAARTDRPFRGEGVTIPALEEVFKTFPEMRMVIEIKQEAPSIVAPFCALLHEYNMTDQVVVATFRETVVRKFRQECPDVPTAAVESEVRLFYVLNLLGMSRAYQSSAYAFQVPEYFGSIHVVTPGFVSAAQHHNIDVQPWTINDEAQMQRMIDAGVQGIMTDYPDKLLRLLGRLPE